MRKNIRNDVTLNLFYESVLKPDPELRQDAHEQLCYHELWNGERYSRYLDRRYRRVSLMTTEGRPFLGPDNTYEKQRQCRMQDAIDDYLNDDKVLHDKRMRDATRNNDVIDYHRKSMNRAVKLKELMLGCDIDLLQSEQTGLLDTSHFIILSTFYRPLGYELSFLTQVLLYHTSMILPIVI